MNAKSIDEAPQEGTEPPDPEEAQCGPDCPCRPKPDLIATEEQRLIPEDGRKQIYLDHSATTPVRPEVLETMLPYFSKTFGNASSVHKAGQKAKRALEIARDLVATCIEADPKEICFTSGGTESDNLAIKGVAYARRNRGRHLITSAVEHHAVLNCCKSLEDEGYEVTYLPVDRFGVVDLAALEEAIRPETILVSVMLANNETGTLQPIAEVSKLTREKGIALHTDAVQAAGKVPLDVRELGVDLLSMSGHKIGGPKGVGVLYVRKGVKIRPLIHGGHHERQRRPGTENIPAIVGFAKALGLATRELAEAAPRLASLRDRLQEGIRRRVPQVHLNGHPEQRLPNLLNLSFEGVEGESLLLSLDMKGIAVSTGSACTSGTLEPSHVLHAMGTDGVLAHGSIRFSLGRDNTEAEIAEVVEALAVAVERLREMSPLYAEVASG